MHRLSGLQPGDTLKIVPLKLEYHEPVAVLQNRHERRKTEAEDKKRKRMVRDAELGSTN
jgi:hypothetical protein